jgi:endonuclease/exonuclease/phosphatase family metal-dependent hydrolase
MAGDFNCTDSSDVQRFLLGECLLNNCESKPCWFDLALSYAELTNTGVEDTLDFRKNPRFQKNTIEVNARFDRILLRNTYPQAFPTLNSCSVFGQTIYKDIELAASDHYGIAVELEHE